jgi:hypothetical protein
MNTTRTALAGSSLLLASYLFACGPANTPTPTTTPDRPATRTQLAVESNRTATAEMEAELAMTATGEAERQATAEAEDLERELNRATATQRTIQQSTERAEPMLALLDDLYAEGYITRTEGRHYRLEDFSERWAQLNWYMWWATPYDPRDFVVRVDADWESASEIADWWSSGCGFVFRAADEDNHYMIVFALDGRAYLTRQLRDVQRRLLTGFYGQIEIPKGGAELVLAVDGPAITFFVNGKRVLTTQDTYLESGNLALTLLSGTNKGFGTHCRMSDIDLWILE